MKRSRTVASFIRPAVLEGIIFITGSAVAICSAVAGDAMHCTALVEFGIVSAIVAVSAGALFMRYTAELCGILVDYRPFEVWGTRARVWSYLVLAAYALLNGILDISIPRRDPDWVSYPGLTAAGVAVLMIALVLQTKYRMLEEMSSRSLLDSLPDDRWYIAFGTITLGALVGHLLAPAWWLDTALDVIFVVLVGFRVRRIESRASLLF